MWFSYPDYWAIMVALTGDIDWALQEFFDAHVEYAYWILSLFGY